MLIILTILLALAIIIVVVRAAWSYHATRLANANTRAREAQSAARILADHIEQMVTHRDSAIYARDFYRAALTDIINCTDSTDPAGQIARRFISFEKTGEGEAR